MKPGNDMPCGCASSVTVALPPPPSCASTSRRVDTDSAANTRSSRVSLLLTIGFSVDAITSLVKPSREPLQEASTGLHPDAIRHS